MINQTEAVTDCVETTEVNSHESTLELLNLYKSYVDSEKSTINTLKEVNNATIKLISIILKAQLINNGDINNAVRLHMENLEDVTKILEHKELYLKILP